MPPQARLRRLKLHSAMLQPRSRFLSPEALRSTPSFLRCTPRGMRSALLHAFLPALCALFLCVARAEDSRPLPTQHTSRQIEGWTVRVDDRLLSGDDASTGERAIKLLTARLVAITTVVPEPAIGKLRAIPIQLDRDHGKLEAMQYHPSAGWLKSNGYSESLAKCVHIPKVDFFLSPFENHRMPWVVLHELAHGYHDQVLGFDEAGVRSAWEKFRDGGKYKSVLTSPGHMREHYGQTDHKEFFAEMTEAYFGSNDFYPFVAGELKQAEPEIFNLMSEIWGPLPSRSSAKKPNPGNGAAK